MTRAVCSGQLMQFHDRNITPNKFNLKKLSRFYYNALMRKMEGEKTDGKMNNVTAGNSFEILSHVDVRHDSVQLFPAALTLKQREHRLFLS